MRLKPPQKSGEGANERITAPGDMLIFVSGQHPIYGTQILYFTDPVLKHRAAIPPPTKFLAIGDACIEPQLPPDRTRNVISRPEFVPQSPMEAAFVTALNGKLPTTPGFIEQLDMDLHEERKD